ncbi:hypothetical protein FIBSPDRAFT_194606 [Athelia psychrophila]|uniref:Uncharacterized protein n=1 Tax=Athelia psychrophila TaxID=1759441 RepID=A0A166SLH0_9AGAM|nr:hypothetical protein FIBSPDRAFT_194606 [Fibularhizoctonia sp. CBS 109695]
MDLFDLKAPSRAFPLLLGGLSDSNTLQVLNRLGFLASLGGPDAILSEDKLQDDGDDKDDGKKDNYKSRRLTLKCLLEHNEFRVVLATVKLLARLVKALGQEPRGLEMESLLLSDSSGAESSSQPGLFKTKGIADRIFHCLALEGPIRGEAVNTIIEIAPISNLRKRLHSLGVKEKLVRMLSAEKIVTLLPTGKLGPMFSAKYATVARSSADALLALAAYSADAVSLKPLHRMLW